MAAYVRAVAVQGVDGGGGERLHVFFATLYCWGPRPEEAVAMRVEDVTLPEPDASDQWCELLIHTATPEVGKQ
ncbi:hypothetical protein [Streptomyces sp. NPDC047841]|uniref:hypothetical protein n=1 Tax=Streptomyces sp. NPDC047841 TaxID=3154708 RepID=UPI0034532BF8